MFSYSLRLASALLPVCAAFAQPRVDSGNLHERIVMAVPMLGSDSPANPRRPLFVPTDLNDLRAAGLLSFSWEPSDDGKHAIVELVARDKAALRPYLADRRVLKAFEKGRARKEDVERELRPFVRNYRADKHDRRPR